MRDDSSSPDKAAAAQARAANVVEATAEAVERIASAAGPAHLSRRDDPRYPGRTVLGGGGWDGQSEVWDIGVGSGEVRLVADVTLHRLPVDVAVKIAAVLAGAR